MTPPSAKSSSEGSGSGGSASGSPQSTKKEDLKASIMGILKADATAIDAGKTKIEEIAEKRKSLQAERKRLSSELRNESRKRQRIVKRSQYLSNEDLVEVLAMRKNKKAVAEAKAASTKPNGAA